MPCSLQALQCTCDCVIADLLAHHSFVRDEHAKPVPYSRVEWWDHPPGVEVVVGRRYVAL